MTVRSIGLAACLLMALAGAARAADPADDLIAAGVELRRQGRDADALEVFQKAYAMSPSGRALTQLALAEFALKRWLDAEAHLSAALAGNDPFVRKNQAVLEAQLKTIRGHVGSIRLDGTPGAQITVNGKPVGALPQPGPVRVAEGTAVIEATAPGRSPTRKEISVAGGAEVTTTLELEPIPPPPAAPSVGAAPASQPQLRAADVSPAEHSPVRFWSGVGLLGVSAAAVTTGIAWLAVDGSGSCDAPVRGQCPRLYDTRVQGLVTLGAGLAAGAAGAVLVWKGTRTELRASIGRDSVLVGATF